MCLNHTVFPSSLEQADLLLKIAFECLFAFKIPSFDFFFKYEKVNCLIIMAHASEFQDSGARERRIRSLRPALATY